MKGILLLIGAGMFSALAWCQQTATITIDANKPGATVAPTMQN
jgi:hypothetical protein